MNKIEELNSYSEGREVRKVLARPENESIVTLLIDPTAESKQYELTELLLESKELDVMSQESKKLSSNRTNTKNSFLKSKYPKYTP